MEAAASKRLYDLVESTRQLGDLSIWTLRKHISAGNVKVVRLGRRVFLTAQEIERICSEGLPPLRAETEVAA